jgi:transposase InsO family protein
LPWIWNRKKKEKYLRTSGNKQLAARVLNCSRKTVYYRKIKDLKDRIVKEKIDLIHKDNPAYGYRRVALALGLGKNSIQRIMHKFGIKPPRRKGKKLYLTQSVSSNHYTNLIKNIEISKPKQVYVSDLTYLKFKNRNIYLTTIEDIFTREIVSAQISDRHDSKLALAAIIEAINRNHHPEIFHTDQGSEFMAQAVTGYLENSQVKISVSDKGSPWQNGYKESFFGRFKEENGNLERFETLGELVEEIYSYLHYYNTKRIHTSLKMSPSQFKQKYLECVSQKSGS